MKKEECSKISPTAVTDPVGGDFSYSGNKMKLIWVLIVFCFLATISYAQDTLQKKETTNTFSAYSYFDFAKSGFGSAYWASYRHNKFLVEARYNFDWNKTVSLYFGTVLHYKVWTFKLMPGITTGNGNTGIGVSPISIYDSKRIFIYNSPQIIIGVKKMPTYFSHWAEFYYKQTDWFWFGLVDKMYVDNVKTQDFSFGSQVSFIYKNFFLNLYCWVPNPQSENRFSILLGYQKNFKRQPAIK